MAGVVQVRHSPPILLFILLCVECGSLGSSLSMNMIPDVSGERTNSGVGL
jgi:hypothetical protein